MRTVLCFGDSNTWGEATVPRLDGRYGPNERWTGVMRASLGQGWSVIEEGLCSRTTVLDDPVEVEYDKNGARALPGILHSHKPLTAVVIMLGTNDHKARFGRTPDEIAAGAGVLVAMTRAAAVGPGASTPRVLLICPPRIETLSEFYVDMFAGAPEKSRHSPGLYRSVAASHGVEFLDAGALVAASGFDGIHLDPAAHAVLGKAVAAVLQP